MTHKFHTAFLGNKLFQNFGTQYVTFLKSLNYQYESITREELIQMNWEELVKYIIEKKSSGTNILLPTGVLDFGFYDNQPKSIGSIISMKPVRRLENNKTKTIALHFRGTDFQNWNLKAVMKPEYYFDSLEILSEKFDLSEYKIQLFTDDLAHQTVKRILNNGEITLNSEKDYLKSFYELSQADVLISSPSTFSYWAGVIGKEKIVVNSKKWIDSEIQRGDQFWIPVRRGQCNFHQNSLEV